MTALAQAEPTEQLILSCADQIAAIKTPSSLIDGIISP